MIDETNDYWAEQGRKSTRLFIWTLITVILSATVTALIICHINAVGARIHTAAEKHPPCVGYTVIDNTHVKMCNGMIVEYHWQEAVKPVKIEFAP